MPMQGLVLDYMTVLDSLPNNYIVSRRHDLLHQSGYVLLNRTNTIEGGAVLKYTNSASLNFGSGGPWCLVSKAGPYRMAVLTSMNDNSVGETIANSTGNPTNTGATYLNLSITATGSTNPPLSYLRFAYAGTALAQASGGTYATDIFAVWNCQFVNCGLRLWLAMTIATTNSIKSFTM